MPRVPARKRTTCQRPSGLDFEHKLKVKRLPASAGNHSSRRVLSWLRTTAGRAPNTCKSSENQPFGAGDSGERVSNTWVINPRYWDSPGKPGLIPDGPSDLRF